LQAILIGKVIVVGRIGKRDEKVEAIDKSTMVGENNGLLVVLKFADRGAALRHEVGRSAWQVIETEIVTDFVSDHGGDEFLVIGKAEEVGANVNGAASPINGG